MEELVGMVGFIAGIFLIIFGIDYLISSYSCDVAWSRIPHQYHLTAGCMINPDGRGMIPARNYRVL